MEFAKYYDVSNVVEHMINRQMLDCYPTCTGEERFHGVYVCADSNDFWICRILKGYNEEYEKDEDIYLIERNKISIYDVMDKLHELYGKKLPDFNRTESSYTQKSKTHEYINRYKDIDVIKAVILLDDYDGLSNWDCQETESLEEAIKIIDAGYGILKIVIPASEKAMEQEVAEEKER